MVPFPEERKFPLDREARGKSMRAIRISHEFSYNPDGGGVLLPPLKDEYKKNRGWWKKTFTTHGKAQV